MTTMIRVLMSLACLVALLLAACFGPIGRTALAAGPITVEGQVANGTAGSAAPAGQTVVLHLLDSNRKLDERSTTTDAFGHFRFADVEVAGATVGVVEVEYQGTSYFGDDLDLGASSVSPVAIRVFEATSSDEILAIERRVVFFGKFDAETRTATVLEMYTIANRSDRTFVPLVPSPSDAPEPVGLRFGLPASAFDLTPHLDLASVPIFRVDTGFSAALPLSPGRRELGFSYQVPYSGSSLAFGTLVPYPTADLRILLPEPGPSLTGGAFAALEPATMGNQRYRVFRAGDLAGDTQLAFVLTGLPTGGWMAVFRQPRTLQMAAVGLGLVALLGVAAYVWGRPRDGHEEDPGLPSWSPEEQALLLSLARLDERHAAGELDDGTYRRLRSERKESLLALLEGSWGQMLGDGGPNR